ncbi:long-chain-fatty-acid--CoA ligase [Diaphorobacter sp. HDW4B]|uniref:long-chain-fatty-acid--CoA ligase n=1 Tax=Diaphorobacter sp. HDW4B TaxID=2714925 RepID=UPI00140D679E|nr:long-chain-fatty-acid--CoA ligase [Diaphorobacter sp. HDW4B]QIL71332.1 long-chain-fatty-acid--CoA ligase [Diaphorobacter sp. HDW4B]
MYLTQALHRAIQQKPNHMASRFAGRQRTFVEFGDRVARLAGALQKLGMQEGDRVAILALNSDCYLEYLMAVPWGGGVLNPCNTRWSAAEILYALNDSGSKFLIVDDTFTEMAKTLRKDATTLREVIYCGNGDTPEGMLGYETLLAQTQPIADVLRRDEDLAGIFYTGGTTGFPKGVMLSHTNLVSSGLGVLSHGLGRENGAYLHVAPMFHLADVGVAMPNWLHCNTHSMLASFVPEAVLDTIERDRITHVLLVPTMIQMLVDHPTMQKQRDLSSLETIIYGASPISEAVLERAMKALPGVGFVQAYGMTELAPIATTLKAEFHLPAARERGLLRSAGRATAGTEVKIVDSEGNEVPRGTIGEVIMRGPNVMLGYWNKPDQTAQAIRNGWMHTGDGGRMDEEGFIFIVDRMKDMIITGGENVYSTEVENAIAKHPDVAACAVIGIPSEQWGEAVHAAVVAKPGSALTAEALIAHCKTLIAGYKCPRSVEIREALPLSGAGKVLKTELRKPFWSERDRKIG